MKYSTTTDKIILFQNKFYNEFNGSLIDPIETQNYQIIQTADSYYLSDFQIAPHTQYCDLEITYVVYNRLYIKTNEVKKLYSIGDIHIAFRKDIHSLEYKQNCRFQTLAVNFKEHSPCKKLFDKIRNEYSDSENRSLHIPTLNTLFSNVLTEFHNTGDSFNELMLDALITSILLKIIRTNSEPFIDETEHSKQILPKILHYIDNNFLNIRNLDELSNYFGYSYNYLYKLFKKYGNESIQSYFLRIKMEHAKTLLLQNKSVEEISEILGYTNPYNFSRAFKKHFGLSPSNIK